MIYLVSGFMRSGTSMMMECLEAGGMRAVKSPVRDNFASQHGDENYHVNPSGLYEPDLQEMSKPGWPRQYDGQALKVVAPWVNNLSVHAYRVIFMMRDAEEIRQSFEGAFGKKLTCEKIQESVQHALESLSNRKDVQEIFTVSYKWFIEDPHCIFHFIQKAGWPINFEKAAEKVNPSLYRFRLERLKKGL